MFDVGNFYKLNTMAMVLTPKTAENLIFQSPIVYGEIIGKKGLPEGQYYVRAYSEWCPDGELGLLDTRYEPAEKITQEEFETAKLYGWIPND